MNQVFPHMKFSLHVYREKDEILVAACDKDILGDTFREDGFELEVREQFYNGDNAETVSEDGLLEAVEEMTCGNFIGEHVVNVLVENGVVDEADVKHVAGVPHVQVYTL